MTPQQEQLARDELRKNVLFRAYLEDNDVDINAAEHQEERHLLDMQLQTILSVMKGVPNA